MKYCTYILIMVTLAACSTGPLDSRNGKPKSTAPGNAGSQTAAGAGAGNGGVKFDGGAFFTANIKTIFESRCISCHADPRSGVTNPGPQTIFNYLPMKEKLLKGPSETDNELISKITNKTAHQGLNKCPGGLDTSPCKELIDWARKEKAVRDPNSITGSFGELRSVSDLGTISGWAADPADVTAQVTVRLYLNGPSGAGALALTAVANKSGYSEAASGNHTFGEALPAELVTNVERQLYAYVVIKDKEILLKGSPFKYTAYKPSAAGMAFWETDVKPAFAASTCASCHPSESHASQFPKLLSPPKSKGGSAANNSLVIYGSGGPGHSNGDKCGGANAGACAKFQAWWILEFGP